MSKWTCAACVFIVILANVPWQSSILSWLQFQTNPSLEHVIRTILCYFLWARNSAELIALHCELLLMITLLIIAQSGWLQHEHCGVILTVTVLISIDSRFVFACQCLNDTAGSCCGHSDWTIISNAIIIRSAQIDSAEFLTHKTERSVVLIIRCNKGFAWNCNRIIRTHQQTMDSPTIDKCNQKAIYIKVQQLLHYSCF